MAGPFSNGPYMSRRHPLTHRLRAEKEEGALRPPPGLVRD
jgi:hypothetical protein